ncbi:Transcriptional regulator [Candidatus Paraburkholderia kirkii]|nr:Transcriptional regulator [Candidatus Paraburkholderia kirkii]
MDALTSLRVFREVVEAGSFVKAAEQLDISTAMTKQACRPSGTPAGRAAPEPDDASSEPDRSGQCSEALDIFQAAEAAVGVQTAQPQGVLKVTAPGWFANRKFADLLVAYQARYPGVLVDLRLENLFVDLPHDQCEPRHAAVEQRAVVLRPLPSGDAAGFHADDSLCIGELS